MNMAASNADPNQSTMAPAVAQLPSAELPKVQVTTTSNGFVTVKWGEGGAQQTSAAASTVFADNPYSFSAVDSNGDELIIKTFGSLLHCDGGVLTIRGTDYRIELASAPPPQQQQVRLKMQCQQ